MTDETGIGALRRHLGSLVLLVLRLLPIDIRIVLLVHGHRVGPKAADVARSSGRAVRSISMSLDDLDRLELASLAREYMLTGQINDRTGLAAVRLDEHGLDFAQTAIEEWMGASPIYTRRLQQTFGFEGDGVPTIFKGLQLDCGFAHQFMDVRYDVTDRDHGRFRLPSCGALLDVEPMGEDLVFQMCHTIEDPTFDATAVATNRHARIRPVHRPPRAQPADPGRDACEWTVVIDPSLEPIADSPLTSRVAASHLAALPIRRPVAEEGDDGMVLYDGPVMTEPHLERFSRDALVVLCREVAIQVHLLVRALALSLRGSAGPQVADAVLESQMIGTCWIVSERLTRLLGHDVGRAGLDAIAAVLELHPAFQPADYAPIAMDVDGDAIRLRLLDGPASAEERGASWSSLLRSGRDAGLQALVQGVNRQACLVAEEHAGGDPSWVISIDPEAAPAMDPNWVAVGRLSGSSDYVFEQRVSIRP